MSVVIQAPVRARMPDSRNVKSIGEAQLMTNLQKIVQKRLLISLIFAIFIFEFGASPAFSQRAIPRDPAEPAQGKPQPKILPRPAGGGFMAVSGAKVIAGDSVEIVAGGALLLPSLRGGFTMGG